jgi:hypothetical protein
MTIFFAFTRPLPVASAARAEPFASRANREPRVLRKRSVTALAAKKSYPVFADETLELFDVISVSSGLRGAQLLLSPADYIRVTEAKLGAISKDK